MLEGARKSYEAYQVVVSAGTAALTGVNLTASSLDDGAGHSLPASDLTFFREAFIDFTSVTAAGGTLPVPANSPSNDGRIPDPLIPLIDPYSGQPAGAPFTVTANLNQPVWLDVYIPETAVPGVYSGTVTVTASGQTAVNVPLTLRVWNLTLPDMNAITTHFKLESEWPDRISQRHRSVQRPELLAGLERALAHDCEALPGIGARAPDRCWRVFCA